MTPVSRWLLWRGSAETLAGGEGSCCGRARAPAGAPAALACEREQHHVVILVRNEGQSQLDQGNMW